MGQIYIPFRTTPLRTEYRCVLEDTIEYFAGSCAVIPHELCDIILQQLNDIRAHIDNDDFFGDADDINERYTLGVIAVQCMEEESEAQLRLFDVFWGILHYSELK